MHIGVIKQISKMSNWIKLSYQGIVGVVVCFALPNTFPVVFSHSGHLPLQDIVNKPSPQDGELGESIFFSLILSCLQRGEARFLKMHYLKSNLWSKIPKLLFCFNHLFKSLISFILFWVNVPRNSHGTVAL